MCTEIYESVVVFYAVKPEALLSRLKEAVAAGFRMHVIGTTAVPKETDAFIRDVTVAGARAGNGVLSAPNFSSGANAWAEQCAQAARCFPEAEADVFEEHHRLKKDAPSGTALFAARAIALARGQKPEEVITREDRTRRDQVCIHSTRGGTVVGYHRASFYRDDEVSTVIHDARSSSLFARGALKAISWMVAHGGVGLYRMYDVLNLALLKELGVY